MGRTQRRPILEDVSEGELGTLGSPSTPWEARPVNADRGRGRSLGDNGFGPSRNPRVVRSQYDLPNALPESEDGMKAVQQRSREIQQSSRNLPSNTLKLVNNEQIEQGREDPKNYVHERRLEEESLELKQQQEQKKEVEHERDK